MNGSPQRLSWQAGTSTTFNQLPMRLHSIPHTYTSANIPREPSVWVVGSGSTPLFSKSTHSAIVRLWGFSVNLIPSPHFWRLALLVYNL